MVVISVLYPVSNVIGALVREKELRIKEGLKMMGLTDAAHTASWIFHFVCLFAVTSVVMVLAGSTLFENRSAVFMFTRGQANLFTVSACCVLLWYVLLFQHDVLKFYGPTCSGQ